MKTKAPKKAKASAAAALTIESLLERSCKAASTIEEHQHAAAIEQAARLCVAAGQPKLAAALAAAVPKAFRGGALAIAAAAGAGSADAAVDAILKEAAADRRYWNWPAVAFAAATILEGKTPRAAELVALVDAIVDRMLADSDRHDHFKPLIALFHLQLQAGAARWVQRVLERALKVDRESLGETLKSGQLIWKIGAEPALALALINAIEPRDRYTPLRDGLHACAAWSRKDLDKLLALESGISTELGKILIDAGRTEDARHVLFSDEDWADPTYEAECHLLLGDIAAVKKALAKPSQVPSDATRLRITAGIETIAKAFARIQKSPPKTGTLSHVQELVAVAHLALDRAEHGELDAIDAAIEKLLASKKRSAYDHGVEWSVRGTVADLRARIAFARGGAAAARASIERDIAGLPALQAYCKDAWKKKQATLTLVRRALRHGAPDLAVTMAKKANLDTGSIHLAIDIAEAFLPGDPGRALQAFDSLTKAEADRMLLMRPPRGNVASVPLLAQLWSAVLAR